MNIIIIIMFYLYKDHDIKEEGGKNGVGLCGKIDLGIISVTVEIKTMALDDLT